MKPIDTAEGWGAEARLRIIGDILARILDREAGMSWAEGVELVRTALYVSERSAHFLDKNRTQIRKDAGYDP